MPQFRTQRKHMATTFLVLACASGATFAATPQDRPSPPAFGAPATAEQLGSMTGGTDTTTNTNQLNATLSDAEAKRTVSGDNAINGGAFSNAAGLPTVIQNSGSNVIIQNATVVNLRMNP